MFPPMFFLLFIAVKTSCTYTEYALDYDDVVLMDFAAISQNIETAVTQETQYGDKVCYEVVGCFHRNGIMGHTNTFPNRPSTIRTEFRLWSRAGQALLDIYGDGMALPREYRIGAPLKVLTHGLSGHGNLTYLSKMREAFLRLEDGNVIVLDWHRGAKLPDYVQACANSELVGREVAYLVSALVRNGAVPPWNVHFIGFSLGAQLLGFAARRLAEHYKLKIGRLSALDSAAPLFESFGVHPRKKDVLYLDAVHTSSGLNLLAGHVGVRRPFGHVDYYPNGGILQNGCDGSLTCSHYRAVQYYVESLLRWTSCRFRSTPWPDGCRFFWTKKRCGKGPSTGPGRMGYFSPSTPARGVHHIVTNSVSPFCKD